MNIHKTYLPTLVLFALSFGPANGGAPVGPVINSRFHLEFVVNNPPCMSIPATVTGDAEVHWVIRVSRNDDGTYRLDNIRTLQGTASDTNGIQYMFHDIDHFLISGSATAPEATPPYILRGTGKIALISKGKTPNVNLTMIINFQVNADGSIVDLGSVFEGDLSCDPSTGL